MIYLRPQSLFHLSFFLIVMIASTASALLGQSVIGTGPFDMNLSNADDRPLEYKKPFKDPSGGIWTASGLNSGTLVGGIDQSFRPEIVAAPGTVRASAVQSNGKLLVGGYFRTINGEHKDGLVRLNADHSIDTAFNVDIRGNVSAIAVQPDGRIVIGGSFTAINGVDRSRIARLNADGSLDASFNVGIGVDNIVNDVLVQPDGKIIIAGSFIFTVDQSNYNIARLNADGSLDTSFSSAIHGWQPGTAASIIYGIDLQTDGKIVAGGLVMMDVNGFPTPRPVVRFNSNGSYDASFTPPSINSNLYDVAVQPDGKIMMGGFFSTIGGTTRRYLARLASDGSFDPAFDAGTDVPAPVRTIFLKADGKVLAGAVTNIPTFGLARQFNNNGALDKTFSIPGQTLTGGVNTISVTSVEKIFVGGLVTPTSGDQPNSAVLFNADGSLDGNFVLSSTALGGVRSVVVQPDGKVLVAGGFNRVNGSRKNLITRLNPDGSVDATFNVQGPSPTSGFSAVQLTSVLRQPDGKILLAGTNINNGAGPAMVVRLNADGSWDSSFLQGAMSSRNPRTIALQPDGKILLAYSDSAGPAGAPGALVRLNADGSIDQSFAPPTLPYEKLIALPDGKILASGAFSIGYVNSGANQSDFYYGVIRLNGNGSHDTSFRAGFYSDYENGVFTGAYAIELQPDGKILVGGQLYTPGSTIPVGVALLEANGALDGSFAHKTISNPFEYPRVEEVRSLPGGRIVAAGLFNSYGGNAVGNIVLLNGDGTTVAGFSASIDNTVHDLAVQTDGKALVGGDFNLVSGISQTGLARLELANGSTHATLFDYDGDGRSDLSVRRPSNDTWYLLRGTAGFTAQQFGEPGDRMVPSDYDGDGKTDVAVFRPSSGTWFIFMSQSQTFQAFGWGQDGDLPVPTDRDNDGKTDLVIYRPGNNIWYTRFSNATFNQFQFGVAGDKPVVGDFDGDGVGDVALFRPSNNNWYIIKSSLGFFIQTWGEAGDLPLTGDFDGDGKTDQAVFRPGTGQWFLSRTAQGFTSQNWGQAGDIPVPADYDGDGKADVAVFRPSNGQWYIVNSRDGILILPFGQNGDVPTQSAYSY